MSAITVTHISLIIQQQTATFCSVPTTTIFPKTAVALEACYALKYVWDSLELAHLAKICLSMMAITLAWLP